MPILGFRHTANFVTNERPENWRQAILREYPNGTAPLFALTSLMKSESTDDPVFHWWQKNFDNRRLKFSGALTNVATAVTVDATFKSAFIVKMGDMLLIEGTGEIVTVTSDPTVSTALVVTRGQAGTSGTAIDAGVAGTNFYMTVIGSAYEEGSLAPSGVNYDPNEVYNYTQIFRNTLEMTRTASKTKLRTGDQVKEAKRECLEIHSTDIERALWFSKKSTGTKNSKPYRTTDGVEAQIINGAPANVIPAVTGGGVTLTAPGVINMNWVEYAMELVFRRGGSEKMMFTSNAVMLAINQVARRNSVYNLSGGEKEYGMRVSRLVSPFGELVIKTHPLFNDMRGGTNGGTSFTSKANNAYILDMGEFIYRHFTGDDMRYEKDLTPVGLDGMKSGYLTEMGVELHHPSYHFIWTGIIGGAEDPP
ncbi:MAG: hypothetical protein DMF62_03655 [Acidobacteria bacterium]|nr:MAG: hypothetical protein DMF62_03655 [Acidobacteriota bacterium]